MFSFPWLSWNVFACARRLNQVSFCLHLRAQCIHHSSTQLIWLFGIYIVYIIYINIVKINTYINILSIYIVFIELKAWRILPPNFFQVIYMQKGRKKHTRELFFSLGATCHDLTKRAGVLRTRQHFRLPT